MDVRIASCSCGQLHARCEGEPVRVSVCHCLECQKRTGSVFAVQARFPRERVRIEGRASRWTRRCDSGNVAAFSFCPDCGSTLCWQAPDGPEIAVAVGAFADPAVPPPHVSVYEDRRHPWAFAAGALPLEHWA